eukprot:scaffold263_cov251-Pinguiococcus_pyrenoidosus.AAC.11
MLPRFPTCARPGELVPFHLTVWTCRHAAAAPRPSFIPHDSQGRHPTRCEAVKSMPRALRKSHGSGESGIAEGDEGTKNLVGQNPEAEDTRDQRADQRPHDRVDKSGIEGAPRAPNPDARQQEQRYQRPGRMEPIHVENRRKGMQADDTEKVHHNLPKEGLRPDHAKRPNIIRDAISTRKKSQNKKQKQKKRRKRHQSGVQRQSYQLFPALATYGRMPRALAPAAPMIAPRKWAGITTKKSLDSCVSAQFICGFCSELAILTFAARSGQECSALDAWEGSRRHTASFGPSSPPIRRGPGW